MSNFGLKEKQRVIQRQVKAEERRLADLNVIRLEEMERQARAKQIQMQKVLEQELLQSIKEK